MSEVFGDAELIWVLLAPIALAVVYFLGERKKRKLLTEFIGARLAPRMIVGHSPSRRAWKLVLRVAAVVLLALAAMRPQWGEQRIEIVRRGIDICFVIDVSKSMLARDVQPSRLERVKQDVRYFVDRVVEDDRIGLVAFAGTARLLCPLTLDRAAFDLFLDDLDPSIISRGGTDLDAALQEAVLAFGEEERNHKAIVLFSDGEGHHGVPEKVLEKARQLGVRIYTVGIGSPEGARIPITDENGNRVYVKDRDGNIVLSRLNDRLLKTIAQKSLDGAYTHLAGGRKNLERIYHDNLKKIEERELASKKSIRRVDRFQWFLAPALALLLMSGMIQEGTRRRDSNNTRGEPGGLA
jgi:Ca-activated chloride channel family protein